MEIKLEHIDLSNTQAPVLYVRYLDPRKTLKERKLALGPLCRRLPAISAGVSAEGVPVRVYGANLEYVLEEAATLAEIKGGVSFEQLR